MHTHPIIYQLLHTHTHHTCTSTGPKRVTVIDFWRMIWQEEVVTIAMVTALREGSDSMCERYWPEFGTVQYGPYLVLLTEQHVLANYTISTLELHLDTVSFSLLHAHSFTQLKYAPYFTRTTKVCTLFYTPKRMHTHGTPTHFTYSSIYLLLVLLSGYTGQATNDKARAFYCLARQ